MKSGKDIPLTKEDLQNIFAERIEKIRVEKSKKNQKDFCKEIGVSSRLYRGWISGSNFVNSKGKVTNKKNMPGIDVLNVICEKYDVSLDYLFGRTDYTSISNEKISAETGLSDTAINGLRHIKEDDNESADLNKMAKLIKKTDSDFHNMLRQRMTIVNYLLSNYGLFEEYIDAFVKYAVPYDFKIPVIKTTDGKWTPFNPAASPIALASSDDNLDDNMIIDIVKDYRAMAKYGLGIVQDRIVYEYTKTDPDYSEKVYNALLEIYKERPQKKK